ncbi:MAG: hypothetical protein ACLTG7_09755 [Romboutsia sp.]
MNFTEIVGSIGFYGACMVTLAIWVDKQIKNNREDPQKTIEILREDSKEDKDRLLNEIAYNREVIAKVVATNDVLAKDLTVKVDKILDKVGV